MTDAELNIENAKVGDRVYFKSEKKPYRIRARNGRYLICTKPFNPRHTVLYTIIDLHRQVRGRDNMIFGRGYEDDESIAENMANLASGEMEVSYRNFIALDAKEVRRPHQPHSTINTTSLGLTSAVARV